MAERAPTIAVCGFPRCGSTMTMAMLNAGGIKPVDGTYDKSFELPDTKRILDCTPEQLAGRSIKLLDLLSWYPAELLVEADWRFLWLSRNPREQARSALKFGAWSAPQLSAKVKLPTRFEHAWLVGDVGPLEFRLRPVRLRDRIRRRGRRICRRRAQRLLPTRHVVRGVARVKVAGTCPHGHDRCDGEPVTCLTRESEALGLYDDEKREPMTTPQPLPNAVHEALRHFVHLDESNAAIHCGDVRYSPITFRLAQYLDACAMANPDDPFMRRVLAHVGQYEEDKGR